MIRTASEYMNAAELDLASARDAPEGSSLERFHLDAAQVFATLANAQAIREAAKALKR